MRLRTLLAAAAATFLLAAPASAGHRHHGGDNGLVHAAERYLGGNPTGWAHNWCARFLRVVLRNAGHRDAGTDSAIGFARYGRAVGPRPGAIAVMKHHVAIVKAVLPGRVLTVSGNHGHKVGIGYYPLSRIIAFRAPA